MMTARISRRDLIKTMGGAAAAAALGRGAFADTSQPRAQEEVDTLIVGSGFGGAVAARRLTEAGIATVMVERGRRWDVASTQDSFSPLLNPDGRSAWLSDFAILG
jgi:cholesterol oxidase